MEHNGLNFSLAVASLKLLYAITSIGAKQLDDVTSVTGRGYQSSVWVGCQGANIGVVGWDHKVDALVNDYKL